MPLIRKIILTLFYPLLWRIVGTWLPRFLKRDLVVSTEYREANKCANFLAKLDTSLESDFVVFSSPPVDLLSILEADACGLYVNRLRPEMLFGA